MAQPQPPHNDSPPRSEPRPKAKRPGCMGCGWGLTGLFNRLILLLILLIIALVLLGLPVIISNLQTIFTKPTTITATVVLEKVQALAQLTTVRYNYSSLVTSEREMPGLLAVLYGEKQVMVAVGHINAGVNLDELTAEDITRDGNTFTIQLPPPVLQDCFLNEQASYVVSRETGVFSQGAPNLDTEARRYAVHQFRDAALQEGILAEVQQQAKTVIEQFFSVTQLEDRTQIHVTIAAPDPAAELPESCR